MGARPSSLTRSRPDIAALGLLLLALALRVYGLGAQSLWNDEGTSVALAPLDLNAIMDAAAKDIHPPLYYWLLHFWMPWVGSSEYAVRFLSVIAGVLVIALTYRIARHLFQERVALLAAGLVSLSAFQVYYSQETRMYIWVTLFATLSLFALVRLLPRMGERATTSRSIWLLYVVATIAMLYTQYVGLFILVAENVAVAICVFLTWRGGEKEKTALKPLVTAWVVAQALVGAAFAPWYLLAGRQLATWPSISEPLDLQTLVWNALNVFSVGRTIEWSWAAPAALAMGLLFILGMAARGRRELLGIAALVCALLVPILAIFIISLSRPAYNPKFLLIATPPFCILAGRGLANLLGALAQWPRLTFRSVSVGLVLVLALASVAVGSILSLRNYYSDPHYARDDYRGMLRVINADPRPGDGILVDDTGQIGVVRYYLRGDQPLYLLPRMRPADSAATRQDVDGMLAKTRRLYAIYYAAEQGDPQNVVQTRLAERAFKARDEWHGDVRLVVYGVAQEPCGAPTPVGAHFEEEITLQAYCLEARAVSPGEVLNLTLTWRVDRPPSGRYKVFVHLLDENGQVVAQRDGEPVADQRMTTTWKVGEVISDNYGVWIDPSLREGDYEIEMGAYRAADGTRLNVSGTAGNITGDHLMLGLVHVAGRLVNASP